ncbi:hypothetical protein AEAC466_18240 [Asticcacaulis sp. AC466]|uniref:hypothetical protein n=1 Tax=Asticcacaulis sp. AC466 TaxID=1282362 RepID=UPI0003C3AC1C|nr:hypothetical protein [Asticcacaulis sp. AC466]ESQ82287.1 hypothetical protein AEAC466_18240 [Asticcacaulis sp. AC466]
MKFRHRRAEDVEEGESYYVSMTDMMVGVLFIFIILLSYFALNYRSTTAALTSAKDSQTALLLQTATALERRDASLEVDTKNRIVCLPGSVLGDSSGDRHCFAYSGGTEPVKPTATIAAADRAAFMSSLNAQLGEVARSDLNAATLSFTADQLFVTGTATLKPEGQTIAQKVAQTLASQLPCYSYGVTPAGSCANDTKMAIVNVVASVNLDVSTPQGRAAQALALEQSVALRDALIAHQPQLAQMRGQQAPGGQPLLQVASYAQSQANAAGRGANLSIEFRMAQ